MESKEIKNKSKMSLIIVIILVLIVGGVAYAKMKTPSAEQAQKRQMKQNQETIASIKKIMVVPEEEPIIATINEAAVLIKEQAFYAGSQNGDKLVIFPKVQKAIIYSPSRNVIVNSGPFTINGASTAPAQVVPKN